MSVHLLNSAFMPAADAVYYSESISAERFKEIVNHAYTAGTLISYIGYPETAKVLSDFTGVKIPVDRSETVVKTGDYLLIAKLKYRVGDPKAKGKQEPTIEDFEFRKVEIQGRRSKSEREARADHRGL